MKAEIERLEHENLTIEDENKKLNSEIKDCTKKQSKFEQIGSQIEKEWLDKEKKLQEELDNVNLKYEELDKVYKKIDKEFKELVKTNKNLSDTLITKNKEYSKLNDCILHSNYSEKQAINNASKNYR